LTAERHFGEPWLERAQRRQKARKENAIALLDSRETRTSQCRPHLASSTQYGVLIESTGVYGSNR
jgi:hypothetical protein